MLSILFFQKKGVLKKTDNQDIRRIGFVTEDLKEIIASEDEIDVHTIPVLSEHLKANNYYLFGYFENNKCVSIASMKIMDDISRIDDVLTHRDHRGKHCATILTNFIVAYHEDHFKNTLYLWAINPIAKQLYLNIGFEKIKSDRKNWYAVKS